MTGDESTYIKHLLALDLIRFLKCHSVPHTEVRSKKPRLHACIPRGCVGSGSGEPGACPLAALTSCNAASAEIAQSTCGALWQCATRPGAVCIRAGGKHRCRCIGWLRLDGQAPCCAAIKQRPPPRQGTANLARNKRAVHVKGGAVCLADFHFAVGLQTQPVEI